MSVRIMREWLTQEEQERADRFIFERHRYRFIAARATLRALLGRYLNRPPLAIEFAYNAHGKPRVADSNLRFSLSHSDHYAIYAFTYGCAIGVDLEIMEDRSRLVDLARRIFNSTDYERWENLLEALRQPAFYEAWVRKEAFTKALGHGLLYSIANIEVTFEPDQPACFVRFADYESERLDPADWVVKPLVVWPNFACAVVVEGIVNAWKSWTL